MRLSSTDGEYDEVGNDGGEFKLIKDANESGEFSGVIVAGSAG